MAQRSILLALQLLRQSNHLERMIAVRSKDNVGVESRGEEGRGDGAAIHKHCRPACIQEQLS